MNSSFLLNLSGVHLAGIAFGLVLLVVMVRWLSKKPTAQPRNKSKEKKEGVEFDKSKESSRMAVPAPAAAGVEMPESEAPPSESEPVDFAVFAPGQLPRGTTQLVDIWAYLSDQFEAVRELAADMGQTNLSGRKTGVPVAHGSKLVISCSIPSLGLDQQLDEMHWLGKPTNASFSVQVPEDAHSGGHGGEAGIFVNGAKLATIRFSVQVGEAVGQHPKVAKLSTQFKPVEKAFASYSHNDRAEVLGRIQGMKTVFPDLDVFIDALSLEAGEHWGERLVSEIVSRDVLYLFWSEHAAASEYVEKEWRLALEKRGLDYIDPVPLQVPSVAPPPTELAELHFADAYATFAYLAEEK